MDDGWMDDGWIDKRMDVYMDGWMDGWMNRWIDTYIEINRRRYIYPHISISPYKKEVLFSLFYR